MIIMITTKDTNWIATTIASDMEINPSAKAFSVSVNVSASEFLNILSTVCETSAARPGFVNTDQIETDLICPERRSFFE